MTARGNAAATVLCVLVDASGHTMSVSSAGHLPPLLLDGDGGRFR